MHYQAERPDVQAVQAGRTQAIASLFVEQDLPSADPLADLFKLILQVEREQPPAA